MEKHEQVGNILVSYLYPEEAKNVIEKINLDTEITRKILNMLSEEYPKMRFVLANDDMINPKVIERAKGFHETNI